jgi:hypothetical protein
MAKIKANTLSTFKLDSKRKRKGVHAKTKMSKIKTSKLYKKVSRGQG